MSIHLPLTGYRIQVSGDGESWLDLEPEAAPVSATEYRHRGLEPGSTRHYRVMALTALGPGVPSEPAEATTMTETETDTLVSNRGRTRAAALATDPAAYDAYSQPFTTGSAAGVTLSEVELEFRSAGTAGERVFVWLHADEGGRPGAAAERFVETAPVGVGPQHLRPAPARPAAAADHLPPGHALPGGRVRAGHRRRRGGGRRGRARLVPGRRGPGPGAAQQQVAAAGHRRGRPAHCREPQGASPPHRTPGAGGAPHGHGHGQTHLA